MNEKEHNMTLRIAQVGMGFWGQNWMNHILPQVAGAECVAWIDINANVLAEAQATLNLPAARCFSSIEGALDAVEVDAVLITTALPGHVPVARAALEANKHVLIEKPFAPTVAEAEEIVSLAAARNRVLMINQNYRFYPAPIAAARLIAEQTLGAPMNGHIAFRRHVRTEGYRYYQIPHPLLVDMSIHHFDLMRMVLGQEPREIYCRTWNPRDSGFTNDPAGMATIAFDDCVVHYYGNWTSTSPTTPWGGVWTVECAEGAIDWRSRGGRKADTEIDRVVTHVHGEAVSELTLPAVPLIDRAGTLSTFAKVVETGVEPPFFSSGRDNVGSLKLTLAAVKSAEANRPVLLDSLS